MTQPQNERSLSDEPTPPASGGPTAPSPAVGPLGNPLGDQPAVKIPVASIVDTILELDEFLSGDVRRAEKTARFCIKPWLEADIDELDAELQALCDERGIPFEGNEEAAVEKATAIEALRVEYGQAFRSVRMGQLSVDKWGEFKNTHRDALEKGSPYPDDMIDELIAASALRPAMTLDQVRQLRARLGEPVILEFRNKAWDVNTESGVSIPKSLISSHVLRRARLVRN